MANKKNKDIQGMSAAELGQHLQDLRQEQFNLRMQRGTGQLSQPHQLRRVRRDIARTKGAMTATAKG